MHYMELGGAELSLIGLLHALNPEKVEVDLFIYSHQGPLMKLIPRWVNLLPEIPSYSAIEKPMWNVLKKGHPLIVLARLTAKLRHKFFRFHHSVVGEDGSLAQYVGSSLSPVLPKINKSKVYDLCISYHAPHNYGQDKVKACKSIAWIHTDYSLVDIDNKLEFPIWNSYDHIVSISKDVTRSFLLRFPKLKSKILEMENILPEKFIRNKADEFNPLSEMDSKDGSIKLLTIGRYCYPKNFDNVPFIAKAIKVLGLKDFKWYIIGYGVEEELIRSKIKEAGMEDTVILLGKKHNPYPYIKACDVYIQPSRFEGKSVTVREAQILGKPVIITNYPTSHSQIEDGVDGVIVELENLKCAQGIYKTLKNTSLLSKIRTNLLTRDYAQADEVNKILDLIAPSVEK